MNEIRLNKYLANIGICSRREAEKLIDKGEIKINGEVVSAQGVKIDPEKDKVEVCKKALEERKNSLVVYALNKPSGYVSSTHKTSVEKVIVLDLLKGVKERVYPVGRLDKDTEGLILLTNDGDLAFRLTHPKFSHTKKYLVEVNRPLAGGALDKLRKGMNILGQKTRSAEIEVVSASSFFITLKEGKNRQIRRMIRKVGSSVVYLQRVQIGDLRLEDLGLKLGKFRLLNAKEISLLER